MNTVSPDQSRHEVLVDFRFEQGRSLADLLQECLRYRNRSYAQVAEGSGVDVAYVYRLCNGHKSNPSRDVIIRVGGWGLRLAPHELDELLLAAGYAPLFYDHRVANPRRDERNNSAGTV